MKVIKTLKGDRRSPRNLGAHIAVGLSITLVGSWRKTTSEYLFRAPMKALCTHTACWTARNTSPEGMQILGPTLRVARRGREEVDFSTRRSWLESYSMNGHEGRWGAVRVALQFAARVQRHISELESVSYVITGIYGSFELMSRAHGGSPTSSFLLCSLFCDLLDLPQGAYLDFPRPREWEMAAGRYRTLVAAYVIQPQDILLRLPN